MVGRKANAHLLLVVVFACVAAGPLAAHAQRAGPPLEEGALSAFTRGVFLLENGRADQSIEPLEEAWRASGHAPAVGARLAEAYYALRDVARAELIADDVLETDPLREDVLQLKARLCYARRDVRASIAYLERVRDVRPASFETERLLASLYSEVGERDKAIAALESCVRIEPSIPNLHILLGDMLAESGRTPEAERAYREALALDPLDQRAVESLTDLLQADGRLAEAIPHLERLAAEPDAQESAALALADAYLQVGRAGDGIALLEGRRGSGRLAPEGEILLGRLYYEAGRNEDAIRIFEPMYDHTGRNPELARILGELHLKNGDAARARTYFESAIAAQPDDYRGYLALFFAQSEGLSPDGPRIEMSAAEAGALLSTASRLVPRGDFDANYAMGMAFSSVDSLAGARVHLARANELKSGDRGTLFNLAAVSEKSGDLEGALRHLVELHAIVPDDAAVANFYGYVLTLMNRDLDNAEALIRSALAKEPENGYFIDSLGWVFYQRGDYRAAANELERALRILGEDPVVFEHLGDAYAALSRFKDALTAYRESDRLQDASPKLREKIESTERRLQ
ncbi:MAG TPA: tetratricopeptide repeat protein [Candidatus Krumholzibacteria bacterium]|nr:tetratricopeptide repeat protein [Candidatus Krumholzibacteria bacterium]